MSASFLRFWGVRGSYAAPFNSHLKVGGNTSCVEIVSNEHTLICDAGTGIIPLGEKLLSKKMNRELLIVLTHYHWDHICGLPFFLPAFTKDWNIDFFGPGQSQQDIKQNIYLQMQAPFFPVGAEDWQANINYICPRTKIINHGNIEISYHNVRHPGVTYGYTIKIGNKKILYFSDNECMFLDKSIKEKLPEFNEEEQQMFKKMNREEYEYELETIRDADILIHDAQYTSEDYKKKRGWGHSCYIDVVNIAIDAGVKELYLYHHDPNYNDTMIDAIYENSKEIISKRSSKMKCHIAKENMTIKID